jgi:hypothetical protein
MTKPLQTGAVDTRNEEPGARRTAAPRRNTPTTTPRIASSSRDETPELLLLLEDYAAGRRKPLPVRLGAMPPDATADMIAVAKDLRLLMGLRMTVCDDRPVPYSLRFCAERMGWGRRYFMRAQRALQALVVAGVVTFEDALPGRGGRRGTKAYGSPFGLSAAGGFEAEPVEVERHVEPALEVPDEHVVVEAEVAVDALAVSGLAASGDAAVVAVHSHDVTATVGPSDPDVERAEGIAARHGWTP